MHYMRLDEILGGHKNLVAILGTISRRKELAATTWQDYPSDHRHSSFLK